ncbi:MAG: AzlC family ABC transporter permease [Rhodoferax sp.]|uniref:AzlC family ABC transporter permease n=1 Tax=Rhodoferax sp. TaxID=50421 RepID=UPI0026235627|nr:AzlC family ABC transporter permease [Rhodoferax sp.]MDD2881555.1 AzlC family ABC transporter permease [Rhodoferax sp.]
MRRWHAKARGWWQHPAFARGLREMAAVSPGLAAWGLMTGVAMVKSGMSTFEAVAMSLLVFAGSSQLAAMPLIAAGAPVWVILSTSFCVNLRFVVFSAHMRPYLMHLPLRWRLFHGYLTADLSYVLFTRHFRHPPAGDTEQREQLAYLSGGSLFNWLSWQSASLLGIALANVIPTHWGLGFAGILALLGVGCSLASSHLRRVSAGVAGMAAVVAYALPLKLNIVVAIASAVALCLIIEETWPKAPVVPS